MADPRVSAAQKQRNTWRSGTSDRRVDAARQGGRSRRRGRYSDDELTNAAATLALNVMLRGPRERTDLADDRAIMRRRRQDERAQARLAGPPLDGPRSISDLIAAIAGRIPSGGMVSPQLIDVNRVVAPYAQARDLANSQATSNRARLEELRQRAATDTAASIGVSRAAAAASGAQQQATMNNTRLQQEMDARSQAQRAAAQGMDPAAVAGIASAADEAIAATRGSADAGVKYADAVGKAAELDAMRRKQNSMDSNTAANRKLDESLMTALIDLNSNEAQARSEAEMANAAARNEAAMANAQFGRQALEDRMGLAGAVFDMAGGLNAYATPYRDTVLRSLVAGTPGVARTAMAQAIRSSDSFEEARAKVYATLDAQEDQKDWDYNWIESMLEKAYQQDQSQVTQQGYNTLLALLGGSLPRG